MELTPDHGSFRLPPRPELGVPRSRRFTFYLGTHKPQHLRYSPVPMFLSYSELSLRTSTPRKRKNAIRDLTPQSGNFWSMDSGGFTQLGKHGRWLVEPQRYADDVRFLYHEVGGMDWAAIQDWMVEPIVLHGGLTAQGKKKWAQGFRPGNVGSKRLKPYEHYFPGTHLDLEYHQQLTVSSYLELTRLAPEVPWAPVLQGWSMGDYFRCVELYERAGVDLHDAPAVGVGSVCRRQATESAGLTLSILANELHGYGLTNLHGFGFKRDGLPFAANFLASADSTAWSYDARFGQGGVPSHRHGYGQREPLAQLRATLDAGRPATDLPVKASDCRNCLGWALDWRESLVKGIAAASYFSSEEIMVAMDRLNAAGGIQMVAEERMAAEAAEDALCDCPDGWQGYSEQRRLFNPMRRGRPGSRR